MLRRKHLFFGGLTLCSFWVIGTWYLTTQPLNSMPDVDERIKQLQNKIQAVEESIKVQKDDNLLLLKILRQKNLPEDTGGKKTAPLLAIPTEPIAVLVFACNRSSAIKNHLDQLIRLRPSAELFPIIVSQDCEHEETTETVLSYGDKVKLIHQPDQRDIDLEKKSRKFLGYYKISRHYKWALNETFFHLGYNTVIITEDDIDIAVDFFEYFQATYALLQIDTSLMCVSAWNDNGKASLIQNDPKLLWRTDFFPGLGWMLTKRLWTELEVKWPPAFWDDWLRNPAQRLKRSCIRPEVPRSAMSQHGKKGVSQLATIGISLASLTLFLISSIRRVRSYIPFRGGLFYEKHLKHIALNREFVKFTDMDLAYLLRDNYDKDHAIRVYTGPSITQQELRAGKLASGAALPPAVRLTYEEKHTYKTTAKAFGLMDDFRAGVPRMAYRGVVAFMFGPTRVYLAPPSTWIDYDPTWN